MMFGRHDPSVNALIRSLQPQAVINGRGFDQGDFSTPERDWDDSVRTLASFDKPTEACQSVGKQSWGYREQEEFYTHRHLIESMDTVFSKGGNYLINVGPDSRGIITAEYADRIRALGKWYADVREAFQDTTVASMENAQGILLTRRGNTLYVHLTAPPETDSVVLSPLRILPTRAIVLNTGEPATVRLELLPSHYRDRKPCLRIAGLPTDECSNTVLVVRLDFKALPEKLDT
jgi:alpha-L-fucosidase